MTVKQKIHLNGFIFPELLNSEGLHRLDETFLSYLREQDATLHESLLSYRHQTRTLTSLEISELIIQCAPFLESFIARLFDIEEALAILQAKTISQNPLSAFKKYFVLRRAKKELAKASTLPSFSELNQWLGEALDKAAIISDDNELSIALLGIAYLNNADAYELEINQLVAWCIQALATDEGRKYVKDWVTFRIPKRLDYANLVATITVEDDPYQRQTFADNHFRLRDGFKLTDERMDARQVQDEINYCIYCHDHDGDFCSKGFPVKKGVPESGFKKNPLNVTLTGCPLEEKISEMHYLKRNGLSIASLAVIMIDNAMCPATGHRICNECMKACIYQKQDPVNIPQIETRVLTDVLDLPWGVEIYDLLTKWNPLRPSQWVMKPYNGLKVMIAGMGPAGFTLAHHLLLEGFAVVGFDGLKIEPIATELLTQPIQRFADLTESLDERIMAGFGGVAEYGITVRWDKNFLKLIYLSLMRRPYFQAFGSVRFGGTITVEDAWEMGFDHFVIAVGAGLPKALAIPDSLAPGMRQANDFLMALQLGNAAKSNSLTNLQIRLPAVVIGGGLTGVDTATELQAYYIRQVEKILNRYESLVATYGETHIQQQFDSHSLEILNEYLSHGYAVREEREHAKKNHLRPNFIKLIRAWGGVTIAYRRTKQESPAYIHNHEELQKALEEGIYYVEKLEPIGIKLDSMGHTEQLICENRTLDDKNLWVATGNKTYLPARSILVATGTQPNIAYEFEHRGTFKQNNLQYQHYENKKGELKEVTTVTDCKDKNFGPFTSYEKNQHRVSLIGDTHPVFHGSVVKAIASGMKTYPKILAILSHQLNQSGDIEEYKQFAANMQHLFHAKVLSITRKTSHVIEITILAPLAAKHFKPGQFYRLQNFETFAPSIHDTLCQIEPLALQTAECDPKSGIITFIVTEDTAAAKLCALLKPNEPVSLMGPTGVRAKIPHEPETVLIVGSQNSFAFVRSYAAKLKTQAHRVLYVCELNNKDEAYCQAELENVTDSIIWINHHGDPIISERANDYAIKETNMIKVLVDYAKGNLQQKNTLIPLQDVARIFIIGNANLMREFQAARNSTLKNYLHNPKVFGSVYGNMQCMLKGVCAQCLQWQIDPETGERTKAVFACSWQDQPLEIIDIDHVYARQLQNRLSEQFNQLWIDYLFAQKEIARV